MKGSKSLVSKDYISFIRNKIQRLQRRQRKLLTLQQNSCIWSHSTDGYTTVDQKIS